MKALIIYGENNYIKDIDTDLDHFYYAFHLRDLIISGFDIEQFLENAYINNSIKIKDVEGAYKIIGTQVYFYEYDFEIWECANDYKNHGEDHTDEMLASMPYTEVDGVKYY